MKKGLALLFLFFALVYVLPLGFRPLAIPDETRYGEVPREMISSGNWISPYLAGVRYFEKPVLGYWMNAISLKVFGQNNFGVRFASAASAGLAALLVLALATKFGGSTRIGIMSAAVFLLSAEVWAIGVFAVLDSHFALFTTATLACFFFAYMEQAPRKRAGWLVLCGISCGLAFMAKGFLAFVVPGVTVLPFLIWERKWKMILLMPWIPALAALLTVLPWSIAIHFKEPDFWNYFIWTEHIDRFLSPAGSQHPEPFYYFIPILIAGAMPWTCFIPAVISGFSMKTGGSPLVRFAVCWLLFPFLFFSASSGKLGTYILPCFPAVAILVTVGLSRYLDAGKSRAFNIAVLITAVFAAAGAAALVVLQTFPPLAGARLFAACEMFHWIAIAAGLLVWAALACVSLRAGSYMERFALFIAAPVLFAVVLHVSLPEKTAEGKAPEEFFRYLAKSEAIPGNSLIVTDDYVGPAVCWYLKRTDLFVIGNGGELRYGLKHPDSQHRNVTVERLAEMIKDPRRKHSIVFIADKDRYGMCEKILPRPKVSLPYHEFECAIY